MYIFINILLLYSKIFLNIETLTLVSNTEAASWQSLNSHLLKTGLNNSTK